MLEKNGPRKIGPRETQKRKIAGWASSIVGCVWNVGMWLIYENPKLDNKHKTRKQSQNRKQKIVGWALSIVVCGEIFLDSFSVLQFGTFIESWRKRQKIFFVCVVESIDRNEKVV